MNAKLDDNGKNSYTIVLEAEPGQGGCSETIVYRFDKHILDFTKLMQDNYVYVDDEPPYLFLNWLLLPNSTFMHRMAEFNGGILIDQLMEINQISWAIDPDYYSELCLYFELNLKEFMKPYNYRWSHEQLDYMIYLLSFVNVNGWKEAFGEDEPVVF